MPAYKNFGVDHYIEKFTKIPEELWGTGVYRKAIESDINGRLKCCALGHCGARPAYCTSESTDLNKLFDDNGLNTVNVNDGFDKRYRQPTPKQRILAALHDIKKQEVKI